MLQQSGVMNGHIQFAVVTVELRVVCEFVNWVCEFGFVKWIGEFASGFVAVLHFVDGAKQQRVGTKLKFTNPKT